MANRTARGHSTPKLVGAAAAGLLIGLLGGLIAARSASQTFVRMLRSSLEAEQLARAYAAREHGEVEREVRFFANVVDMQSQHGLCSFAERYDLWPIYYPLVPSERSPPYDEDRAGAVFVAELARALERAGRKKEADLRYEEAAREFGVDAEKLRATRRNSSYPWKVILEQLCVGASFAESPPPRTRPDANRAHDIAGIEDAGVLQ